MKIEIDIDDSDIQGAIRHGIKRAIADRILDKSNMRGEVRSNLECAIDQLLPKYIAEAFEDVDIKKILDDKIDIKAKACIQKMIGQVK